jgi:ubiquinone biosynthesis protein COQ9
VARILLLRHASCAPSPSVQQMPQQFLQSSTARPASLTFTRWIHTHAALRSQGGGDGGGGTTTAKTEEKPSHEDAKSAHEEEIVDERTLVLHAAMAHVRRLGWMEAALVAGARDVGLSPSIVGSFQRKDAALVEFFMDDCNHKLQEQLEGKEKELSNMLLADRIASIVRMRLEMNVPVITKWASALSIQANPLNAATALKQRAQLVDDIWHAAGDRSSDMDWYTKRALLGAVYMTAELYMLTDFTPGCGTLNSNSIFS